MSVATSGSRSPLFRGSPQCLSFSKLLYSEFHNSADQCVGNRLSQRKLQVALLASIRRDLLHQPFVAPHRRIKADVPLESSKVDQDSSAQCDCRHSIADLLLGLRRRFADRQPDLSQDRLHFWRERGDVFGNTLGLRSNLHGLLLLCAVGTFGTEPSAGSDLPFRFSAPKPGTQRGTMRDAELTEDDLWREQPKAESASDKVRASPNRAVRVELDSEARRPWRQCRRTRHVRVQARNYM